MPFYKYPRVDNARIKEFKKALSDTGVILLLYYQCSIGLVQLRVAAVRNWKRVIEIAVEMGVDVLNTEFTGHNDKPYKCEQMFVRSMEELIPYIEKEGLNVHVQAHPFDFIEKKNEAVDFLSGFDKDWLGIHSSTIMGKVISLQC
jgi:myo-inositol catabolism protein IolH